MSKQCEFIKQNGDRCGAYAVQSSQYCINHEESMKETKQNAVAKGGSSDGYKTLNLNLEPFEIKNTSDVVIAVVQTINELRSGKLPPKLANTVGYLLGIAIKAFEVSEIDKKIEAIDRVILERKVRK